jgi:YidC/Oxa1 family membrane protein insertase
MDWKKSLNIAAIGFVAWLLIIEWSNFQDDVASQIPQQESELTIPQPSQLPNLETQQVNQLSDELPLLIDTPAAVVETPVDARLVTVTTDAVEVTIDTLGGDIVQVKLLKHLTKMAEDGGEPFTLLTRSSKNEYIAQSGLIGKNGTDTREGRGAYSTSASQFSLESNQSTLNVDLTLNQNGVRLVKRFSFSRSGYVIGVSYLINNSGYEPWEATFYGQIKRDSHEPLVESSGGIQPYLGAALREADKNFAKHDFSDIQDETVKSSIEGGWVAMVQHYFVSAWIPPGDQNNNFSLRKLSGQDVYLMGFTGEKINVAPGSYGEYTAQFYVGPKDQAKLEELAEYLDLTVDYGFLWMLAKPIFAAMKFIHEVVGNWGWSIILLTIGIKILLYPLSAASLRSMAKMRSLQPKMERLKEKVNPAGGCFPMLLQMPVFLALYWVLLESVEIRHSPWVFWIDDLSAKDPYFILPLVMGASMLLMQKLQPMPTDPTQAMVMKIMPIAFTFFFMIFPSGLVLYWTVNNLLSMFQQWYVNRQLASASAVKK